MNFNENQIKAIRFAEGNCNVIATAGSGKTGVLTNRIKHLIEAHGVKPGNILAITFSKKAKDTMISRLSELIPSQYESVNVETFHSLGYKIIRDTTGKKYSILNDTQKLIIIDKLNKNDLNPRTAINHISRKKNLLERPDKDSKNCYDSLYRMYELEKQRQGSLDFDDMLIESYEILAKRKSVLDRCISRYKYVLIDEAQDMNKAQYEIIRLIGKPNNNVFIVNDPIQNIYEWRGSDNTYVLEFHKVWDDVTVINLDINYRSTKNIVELANKFARTIEESNHEFYVESNTSNPAYKSVALAEYKHEFDEAFGVGKQIEDMVSTGQYSYRDFCVLARTNAQSQVFETAFYNRGLPYCIVDGLSFVERKEVKIILSYLRLSSDLNDNESFEYIYNKPNRWLGKAFLDECRVVDMKSLYCAMFEAQYKNYRFQSGINELCTVINTLKDKKWKTIREQIQYLRKVLSIDEYVSKDIQDDGDDNEKIENLNSLEQIAARYQSLSEFLSYMSKLAVKEESDDNYIKISTIHKSKGLEFPVVFLVGLNDGLLPHSKSMNHEEERRLAYVAITRAEKELYCSYIDSYHDKEIEASLFIEDMFDIESILNNINNKRRKIS